VTHPAESGGRERHTAHAAHAVLNSRLHKNCRGCAGRRLGSIEYSTWSIYCQNSLLSGIIRSQAASFYVRTSRREVFGSLERTIRLPSKSGLWRRSGTRAPLRYSSRAGAQHQTLKRKCGTYRGYSPPCPSCSEKRLLRPTPPVIGRSIDRYRPFGQILLPPPLLTSGRRREIARRWSTPRSGLGIDFFIVY